MRTIINFDSWGDKEPHQNLKNFAPNVTWIGEEFAGAADPDYHPHGGMVACVEVAQIEEPLTVISGRMLNARGSGGGFHDWMIGVMEDANLTEHDGINMSFGGGAAPPTWFKQKFESASNGCMVTVSAGNSGKDETNHPALTLMELPNVAVVGACDHRGVRASWSSTGPDGVRYVTVMSFGERILVIDPLTGRVVSVNGTSFSSPGTLGACIHHGWTGSNFINNMRAYILDDADGDGFANGINPVDEPMIRAGEWHQETGMGCPEGLRQAAINKTGRSLGVFGGAHALEVDAHYHDFERTT